MFVNEERSIHVLFIRILISHKNVNALLDFEFFLVCRKKNTHGIFKFYLSRRYNMKYVKFWALGL